jgi:hypothetical protein
MGIYSTLNITRGKAKQIMADELLGDISDDKLERFMDAYLESQLYNCRIVADGDEYNNDEEL